MTDPRRQTIAALQQKPADLQLLIANKVLCGDVPCETLRLVADALGIDRAMKDCGG